MRNRIASLWLTFSHSLGFIPGLVILVFAAAAIVLAEVDQRLDLENAAFVFTGDASAARTVLSVIAGSIITVAGLTFSVTMVVLQLASSQFSPRILRTYFGDRMTQVTVGVYVGTFVYALLVLRAVGSDEGGFVPRLSVTVATLLGIGSAILLAVFLHHVSQMVQVSHVSANIARDTLARVPALYPARHGEPVEEVSGAELMESWRAEPPGRIFAERPGYVQRVAVEHVARQLEGRSARAAILVCPGDFVSVEMPVVEIWPAEAAEECRQELAAAIVVRSERDLSQDVDFGVRQLADTALKALSPGINDPMTAVTCIGYVRSILIRLTERAAPPTVRRFPEHGVTVAVRERTFEEYLRPYLQISRYVRGDAWVATSVLDALSGCAAAAVRVGAVDRGLAVWSVAVTIARQAREEAGTDRDREAIDRALQEVEESGRPLLGTVMR